MLAFNEMYRATATTAGAEFIDIWDGFIDENGAFVSSGPDINGQPARLRANDGINFTAAGRRKLAFYAESRLPRSRPVRNRGALPALPSCLTPIDPSGTYACRPDAAHVAGRSGIGWRRRAPRGASRGGKAAVADTALIGARRESHRRPCRRFFLAAADRGARRDNADAGRPDNGGDAVAAQRGSTLDPMSVSSIARAACRPSRIAHTTSDWPRRTSPAAKSRSTFVR